MHVYRNDREFNTALGDYKKPYFPAKEMFAFIQKAEKAEIKYADYTAIMNEASRGDVVYCDPPYVPLDLSSLYASFELYCVYLLP